MRRAVVVVVALAALAAGVVTAPASGSPGTRLFDVAMAPGASLTIPAGTPVDISVLSTGNDRGEVMVHPCDSPLVTASSVAEIIAGRRSTRLFFSSVAHCLTVSARARIVVDELARPAGSYHAVVVEPAFRGSSVPRDEAEFVLPASIPADVTGVAVDVRIDGTESSTATVYACGTTRPDHGHLSVDVGTTARNVVWVPVVAGQQVCVHVNDGAATVEVDLLGWFGPAPETTTAGPLIALVAGTAPAPGLSPIPPNRILDTRSGITPETGPLEPGIVRSLAFPADITAVALNVTVTEAAVPGFVTVFPCDGPHALSAPDRPPLSSNLNYGTGQTVANAVIVGTGVGAAPSNPDTRAAWVCLVSQERTHVVVDHTGSFLQPGEGDGYSPLDPVRLLDTRDGTGRTAPGLIPADSFIEVLVSGRGGVPVTGATAVSLNVTVTGTTGDGFITVWPCGRSRPGVSNLNAAAPAPGQTAFTRANMVIVPIGAGGRVCLYTQGAAHLLADVSGWFGPAATGGFVPIDEPERLFDSRLEPSGLLTPVARSGPATTDRLLGNTGVSIPVTRRDSSTGLVIDALVMNVTVVDNVAEGFLTAYPCGTNRPVASNLNFDPPRVVPSLTIVKYGAPGVCLFPSQDTHALSDLMGYFTSTPVAALVPQLTNGGTVLP